jgi:Uma2 family endonuclease
MDLSEQDVRIARPRAMRWTLKDYYQMLDAGLFDGKRVELIEGEIVAMPPMKSAHYTSVPLVQDALTIAFGPGHVARAQAPLHLSRRSAPEPDIAVVPGTIRTWAAAHPTTALLVVEVSDATLSYDRNRKSGLYARAGISDYWIVNLGSRVLEVRRKPIADASVRYGHRYDELTILGPSDNIAPLAAPSSIVNVVDLLP